MAQINLKSLLFELVFDNKKEGISAVSVVENPAILTNFVKFAKDKPDVKIVLANEEQRIIAGPIIIPNIKIFRSGKSLGLDSDAYVFFREETIRALAEDYNEKLKIHNATEEHKEPTTGIKMMENWIVEDTKIDKSALYGFELPAGSWFGMYRVHDDELWEKIKAGELQGFSIEAALGLVAKGEISLAEEEKVDPNSEDFINLGKEIVSICREVGEKQEDLEKQGWELLYEDEEIGSDEILTDEETIALVFAIESDPEAASSLDKGNYAIRYKYVVAPGKGEPIIPTSRQFCIDMINADLIYRKENIDAMSFRGENPIAKQNYSIFKYKGAWNCRHIWKRLVFVKTDNPVGEEVIPGYRPVPNSDLPKSYEPNDDKATDPNATKVN